MIFFKNITKIYSVNPPGSSPIVALENVSFEVKEGEFVLIVGKSGAGKTTLVRLLSALEKPTSGEIFFKDINVHKIKSSQLPELRRKIGVIYQDYKLLSTKTVFENVAYVLAVKGEDEKTINQRVPKILELTGLEERANNFPKELSGGEQQRVAIARALIAQPEVVVADEPTGNLDPYHTHDVISLLKKIHQMGKTVILATHDKEIINNLGQRTISLDKGRVIRDDKKGRFIL